MCVCVFVVVCMSFEALKQCCLVFNSFSPLLIFYLIINAPSSPPVCWHSVGIDALLADLFIYLLISFTPPDPILADISCRDAKYDL